MDKTTACLITTGAGIMYGAQCYLLPSTYLKAREPRPRGTCEHTWRPARLLFFDPPADGVAVTDDTESMTRSTGAGILGLASMGYMAAKSSSDECKMLALCSGATAFIAYTLNNAYRVMNKGSTQATIDLAAGIGLLTVCTAALLK